MSFDRVRRPRQPNQTEAIKVTALKLIATKPSNKTGTYSINCALCMAATLEMGASFGKEIRNPLQMGLLFSATESISDTVASARPPSVSRVVGRRKGKKPISLKERKHHGQIHHGSLRSWAGANDRLHQQGHRPAGSGLQQACPRLAKVRGHALRAGLGNSSPAGESRPFPARRVGHGLPRQRRRAENGRLS